jgi:hypothetical protein
MNAFPDSLLVSCPNGGGVFFVSNDSVLRLDERSVTGLYLSQYSIVMGVQESGAHIINNDGLENIFINCFDIHDVLYHEGHYYLVGTQHNEILCVTESGLIKDRWILEGEDDSCHINSLALWNGRLVFSAFGDFKKHRGYKDGTKGKGFVQEVETGRRLITGLSQPHSLVPVDGGDLFLANSECFEIVEFSDRCEKKRTFRVGGYARGVFVGKDRVYVGISKSRNVKNTPVGSAVLVSFDRQSMHELGRAFLPVDEIYDVIGMDQNHSTNALALIGASALNRAQAALTANHNLYSEEINRRDVSINALNRQILEMESRLSWRLTAPLRRFYSFFQNPNEQ